VVTVPLCTRLHARSWRMCGAPLVLSTASDGIGTLNHPHPCGTAECMDLVTGSGVHTRGGRMVTVPLCTRLHARSWRMCGAPLVL
jgi:hypothetical protein